VSRGEPPRHVSPARLFRILLRRPRARIAIPGRLRGAEETPLFAQALTGLEWGEARDEADGLAAPEARIGRLSCGLIARALVLDDGARVFADAAEAAELLEEPEVHDLGADVLRALAVIGPTYAHSDAGAWAAVLAAGARDAANLHTAFVLGRSIDVSLGSGLRAVVSRPDRFFGCPLAELTDGQWLAFRAARKVVEDEDARRS
jgi:hypothetical protein